MSNNAKIDNNYSRTGLASDGTASGTEPLRVDPVTSRLLIDAAATTSTTPSSLPANASIDSNYARTSLFVTDNAVSTITPAIIDNRNGYLFVDLIIE